MPFARENPHFKVRRPDEETGCPNCGEPVYVGDRAWQDPESEVVYCSRSCAGQADEAADMNRRGNPFFSPPALNYQRNPGFLDLGYGAPKDPSDPGDRIGLPFFTQVGTYQIRYFRFANEKGICWEVFDASGDPVVDRVDGDTLWGPRGKSNLDFAAAEREARAFLAEQPSGARKKVNPARSDFEVHLIDTLVTKIESARDAFSYGAAGWQQAAPGTAAWHQAGARVASAMGELSSYARQMGPRVQQDPNVVRARSLLRTALSGFAQRDQAVVVSSLNMAADSLFQYGKLWTDMRKWNRPDSRPTHGNPFFSPPALNYQRNPAGHGHSCESCGRPAAQITPEFRYLCRDPRCAWSPYRGASPSASSRPVYAYTVRDVNTNAEVAQLQAHNLDEARQLAAGKGFSGRRYRVNRTQRNPGDSIFYVFALGAPEPIGSVTASTKRRALGLAKKKFKRQDVTVEAESSMHTGGGLFGHGLSAEDELRLKKEATGGQEFLF
jgi:hypothetical protein